jgi:hypothetical protein
MIESESLTGEATFSLEKPDSYFRVLIGSFFNMPKELNRLYICETIGWLAFYSTTLFFTDFVAHVS